MIKQAIAESFCSTANSFKIVIVLLRRLCFASYQLDCDVKIGKPFHISKYKLVKKLPIVTLQTTNWMIFNDLIQEKKIEKFLVSSCKMDKLKDNILWYRKKKGWSQEKMGAIFNLSRENIASYERGLAKPGIYILSEVCKDLKVYLHEFINEDMTKFATPNFSQLNQEQTKILATKDDLIKQLQKKIEEQDMVIDLQKYKLEALEKK